MRPLRFAFPTTFYPPYNFGGDGIGIQRLARGLVRRGHQVTVIHDVDAFRLLRRGPDPEIVPEPEGLEVVRLESGLGSLSVLLTQQTGRPVVNAPRLRRILDEGDFDVVNFHNLSLIGGPGLLSYGGDALRVVMAHEHWLVCPMHVLWRHKRERCVGRECLRCTLRHGRPPQLHRYSGYMERQLEKVDTFIAMSEFSREKHKEFGFRHPMEVLSYFLPDPEEPADPATGEASASLEAPPEEESPHGERPYFLFVGRLEKIKGLDDVIPLFREYEGADLVIAGDGEFASELKAQAEGLDRVRFLGRVPLEELGRYYRHAQALIVPSVCFETFGIILIEAFRNGTPVIARRLGPFPEIVSTAGGGELFDSRDDLRMAMERIQRDPHYRETLAKSGHRAFRERWTESAVIPQYLDILRRAAERTGRSAVVEALNSTELS
jgi:glycosyltransferase involved in cell wall biosynthesis